MRDRVRVNKNKRRTKISAKFVAIFFILAILFFVTSFSVRQITNSNFFRVKRIKIRGDIGWLEKTTSPLINRNLMNVDLKKVENVLRREHPEIETIVLSKLWPDTIYVRFTLKRPIAIIQGAQDSFLVDSHGFSLSRAKYEKSTDNLPLISGIGRNELERISRLGIDEKLAAAINIIQLFSRPERLGNYKLIRADVSKVSESTFFINKNIASGQCMIQVNVGIGGYVQKLRIFEIFLKKTDFDWSNINYIDLRFKEPIVGLKNG